MCSICVLYVRVSILCCAADHADAARMGHPVRGAEDPVSGRPGGPLLVGVPRLVARRRSDQGSLPRSTPPHSAHSTPLSHSTRVQMHNTTMYFRYP